MSPPLKNALDWCSRPPVNAWDGKPAAVMGAGGMGGTARAQYALRQSAVYVNLLFLCKPEVQLLAFQPGNFDMETGDVLSDDYKRRITELVAALAAWTRRLQS